MPGGYLFPTEGGSEDGAVTAGVQAIAGTTELRARCEEEEVAIVLGSDWVSELLDRRLDKLIGVSNPVVKKITLVSKPYYGFRGALHFLEDALNAVHY